MAKVQETKAEKILDKIVAEPSIDNKIEILKFISQVQSRIKKDISEDFVLAKLGDKDKEGIIEMTSNAYFVKKILYMVQLKSKKWDWDDTHKQWIHRSLYPDEQKYIKELADSIFDSYLTRIYMTVILNRNVSDNHILNLMTGSQKGEEESEQAVKIKDALKELAKPEGEMKQ
jgi:hypothetical protein